MTPQSKQVHEPDAPLLSAEDAIHDAAFLKVKYQQGRRNKPVPLKVPLWVLLEAIDSLDREDLSQIIKRAEDRLSIAS